MSGELNPTEGFEVRDPYLGRTFGDRFVLDRRLGSGAMGFVYKATDRSSGTDAAVKILRPELMSDWSLVKRFNREARAVAAVESPHVVRILEHGESGDLLYIAMELLDGESLGTRIERAGPVPLHLAVRIARAVAHALDAAHRAGVVHRDLKPENVMLTADGGVKVVDFGIARILEGSDAQSEIVAALTVQGSIIGTPLYMSPEGAGRKAVGPPADLYALGLIIHEMIGGEPPFVHDNPMMVIGMHLRTPPPLLEETAPDVPVPAALEGLVEALLVKDPAERPTAAAALEALDALATEIDATTPSMALPETEAPDTLEEKPFGELLADDADATTNERENPPVRAAATVVDPPRRAEAIHSMPTVVPRHDAGDGHETWVMPPQRQASRLPLLVAAAIAVLLLVAFALLLVLTG